MTMKYWQTTRSQDIESAKSELMKAHRSRNKTNRADNLRVARLYIDSVRYCDKQLEKYRG